ncbi:mechanosensitive ion channel [bacterium]|nr:mechanosensitive ion channel [bacterium]PIV81086.1 MAG: mechanosensitive ion channel protein MscS [bacterium CG17_big_fil_post_rev_8_21_14_2_50_64_8]PJA74527.1 MAG: mechanosensitive ion channel protein MscS [bacterium CG_4_9_14_3_um_filter_65_15]
MQTVMTWSQDNLGLSPSVLAKLSKTLVVWVLFIGVQRVFRSVADRRLDEVSRRYIVHKTFNYITGILIFIATMIIWFGGFTGWTAYLGFVSAGLAIALQDPLSNLAGWIFINSRKPFVVGDRIEIGGIKGDVIDQRLFQFSLIEIGNWVDADQSTGRILHIPNGWVFKNAVANFTAGFEFIWNEVPVMVTFESDWKRAKEILLEIAERHSAVQSDKAARQVRHASRKYMIFFQHLTPIVWTSVADSGVVLTLRYICDPRKRRSSATGIWEDVLTAFAESPDIDFAYPTTRFYDNPTEGKPETGGPPAP